MCFLKYMQGVYKAEVRKLKEEFCKHTGDYVAFHINERTAGWVACLRTIMWKQGITRTIYLSDESDSAVN